MNNYERYLVLDKNGYKYIEEKYSFNLKKIILDIVLLLFSFRLIIIDHYFFLKMLFLISHYQHIYMKQKKVFHYIKFIMKIHYMIFTIKK